MKRRIEWWLENKKKLPSYMQGFRNKRGTYDVLTSFVYEIHNNLAKKNCVLTINLDLENAYNRVQIPILINILYELKLPKRFIVHIYHLLKDRKLVLRCKDTHYGPRYMSEGLPQGSVLSPLLFNVYTAHLQNEIGQDARIMQYADDLILSHSGVSLNDVIKKMDQTMTSFGKWTTSLGFSISENKSAVSFFTRQRNSIAMESIKLGRYTLKIQTTTKCLGLTIDNKLRWGPHLENLSRKCEDALNILRVLNHMMYGADVKVAIRIYKQLILSKLDYGCFIYGDASKNLLRKLDTLQNKAIRYCLGVLRSTPINALHVEAHIMPLHLRRKLLATKFVIDRIRSNNVEVIQKISSANNCQNRQYWQNKKKPILMSVISETEYKCKPLEEQNKATKFYFNYEITTTNLQNIIQTEFCNIYSSPIDWGYRLEIEDKIKNTFPDFEVFFTDGSKGPEGVGACIYHQNTNLYTKYKLDINASIYTAEMYAINKCIRNIASLSLEKAVVFSDSRSSLESLLSIGRDPSFLVLDTLNHIHNILSKRKSVYLIWIKSHIGVTGNEAADKGAKDAINTGIIVEDGISHQDIKNLFKAKIYKEWQLEFQESSREKGQFYAAIQEQIPVRPWFDKFTRSRHFYCIFNRLRTNHTFTPFHLNRIGININPYCHCLGEANNADANHLIMECRHMEEKREKLWNKLTKLRIPLPTNLRLMLADTVTYDAIYEYICETRLMV
ncbi:uncharacterized protein LOC113388232 [Ctenocephalides felis]|nr:uncharacterized protein LOC113388232 [Ctenocephalides felis]